MARAPDARIEQAKAMYLDGKKLDCKSTKSARGNGPPMEVYTQMG